MQLPNPVKIPLFRQKIQWTINPVGFLEKVAQQYPDIFTSGMSTYGNNTVFVHHPQAMQEILTNDRKKFIAPGDKNKLLQPLVGNNSVFLLEGERHKRQRQLLMPPLHGEQMQAYGKIICNLTEKVFSQIPLNTIFTARNATQEIALQVMVQAVFGLTEGERYQELKRLLGLMMDVFSSPLSSSFIFFPFLQKDFGPKSPWGRFVRQRQQVDEILYAEIAERRKSPEPNRIDILSLLMSARDEEGKPMTELELRDEMMTLLVAGYETTATAIAWALYWIHQKPEVVEQLRQELDSESNSAEPMSIVRLPYLTATCNETLRIRPIAMLTLARMAQEPTQLLGYQLEPGTVIAGCIYLLHHREDLYPQPKEFKPERFLERQFSPYEFMPFGGGVRRCVGDALAVFEMKLVLATILSRYELALAENQPEKPKRRGVTLAPARGVKMMITGRRALQKSPQTVASA
jgi:cytochrome P450